MELWRYIILILVLLEIIIYVIKYWTIIPIKYKAIYKYGIPIFKEKIRSKNNKIDILNFITENIKPKKIIDDEVYLRRKYLKWIPWATPVPLQCIIIINSHDDYSELEIRMKTLFITLIGTISPLIIIIFSSQITFSAAIFSTIIFCVIMYMLAHIERKAILNKINKCANLNNSYSYFS